MTRMEMFNDVGLMNFNPPDEPGSLMRRALLIGDGGLYSHVPWLQKDN